MIAVDGNIFPESLLNRHDGEIRFEKYFSTKNARAY
jgi:hypothetical protein